MFDKAVLSFVRVFVIGVFAFILNFLIVTPVVMVVESALTKSFDNWNGIDWLNFWITYACMFCVIYYNFIIKGESDYSK